MTLFDLLGPLAAALGIGVLYGDARAESSLVIAALLAGGSVSAIGLVWGLRAAILGRWRPASDTQVLIAYVVTFAVVLGGTVVGGFGIAAAMFAAHGH